MNEQSNVVVGSGPTQGRVRRPPMAFWPLVVFSAAGIGLETFATVLAGIEPDPGQDARDSLASLETSARQAEWALVNLTEEGSTNLTELADLGTEAEQLAGRDAAPPYVRLHAAAIWLFYRDLDALRGDPGVAARRAQPVPALATLLAKARVDAPEVPKPGPLATLFGVPGADHALYDVLAAVAAGRAATRAELDALGQSPMSPWLRSRLGAWLRGPSDALESGSPHAMAERAWAERYLGVLASAGIPFLVGLVLIVFWPFLRRFVPAAPVDSAAAIGTAAPAWAPWYVLVVWLTSYLALGYVMASAGRWLGGVDRSALQVVIQLVAAGLALTALRTTVGAPALTVLKPGLAPFDGRVGRALLWGLGAYSVAIPVVLAFGFLSSFVPVRDPVTTEIIDALLRPDSPAGALLMVISAVALAPFFEELIFRGVLFRFIRGRIGFPRAAVISAAIFALIHANPANALPLFGLGLVLAAAVERSGGLLPAIIVHALWNGSQLALMAVLHS